MATKAQTEAQRGAEERKAAASTSSRDEQASSSQQGEDGSREGFAVFSLHPVAGPKYLNVFEDFEQARATATFESNAAEGGSPSEYGFLIIPGVTVVEGGPQNAE